MELPIRPETSYEPREDFLRVAAAVPEVAVGDVITNVTRIADLYDEAAKNDASLVVFPELSVTGYTLQDLVQRHDLLATATDGLNLLASYTEGKNAAMVVGLPIAVGNAIYNAAALLADGEVKGIVPKQNLPTYNEFYEKRWFQSWDDRPNTTVRIGDTQVPFGRQQLFEVAGAPVGIEICEDLWVTHAPHEVLADNGALLIANPSASPEAVAKAEYRRNLVGISAAKAVVVYVYASTDSSESTAEVVMSGHAMINENGYLLAERPPLRQASPRIILADVDASHLRHDRHKNTNYPNARDIIPTPTNVTAEQTDLRRSIDSGSFIPKGSPEQIAQRLDTVLDIQALGLARRLKHMDHKRVALGLSGGLDSTLALLVAMRAAAMLDMSPSDLIYTLTLPGQASSERTQNNATQLSSALNIPNEEIAISELATMQLEALGHTGEEDITFENTHARLRQAFIFNKANQIGALALGTGDLSEAALGWCTYGGDQTSGYHVNASIPKTLVRSLVRHAATELEPGARALVHDILDTPVSPELTGDGQGITQTTEDIIGPYELHDFFLYHFVRWAEPARKIGFLALQAFEGTYSPQTIDKWLNVFIDRFYANQWKRQASPDSPKVGLSLGPRGDWRMPPDIKRPLRKQLEYGGVV
jgi:NAD+ synthase (glutamine-hydrolysing)